jgi:DNA-binding NtrC family response regulator
MALSIVKNGVTMNLNEIEELVNDIDKPSIFITPDYVVRAANSAYLHHINHDLELGKSRCYQVSHQSSASCDQHGEECPLLACKQHGRSGRAMHIHQTGTGHAYCDILMRPVIDKQGMTIGYIEIIDKIEFASDKANGNALIGVSDSFKQMLKLINRSAKSDISVLLQGETGTGKELTANAIHQASKRSNAPFVVVECTGLTEALFESELFGYEKGAFTGATKSKPGLIDACDGGTLFLDEVGDIPLNQQVKLLRLLETGRYRPVGSIEQRNADFRLVCASHKNLPKMVETGEFRSDLYYRIAAFVIELPSLKQRREDIPLLANHFLQKSEFSNKTFSEKALYQLKQQHFPGNIRELKNLVHRSALMSDDKLIEADDLGVTEQASDSQQTLGEHKTLIELEKGYLTQLCSIYDSSQINEMARVLGISPRTLYRKLHTYHLKLLTKK